MKIVGTGKYVSQYDLLGTEPYQLGLLWMIKPGQEPFIGNDQFIKLREKYKVPSWAAINLYTREWVVPEGMPISLQSIETSDKSDKCSGRDIGD